jgi:hypothetical protein
MQKVKCGMVRTYGFESLIDNAWMLEIVIGKEVKLIQKVPDVDTAKRIHL